MSEPTKGNAPDPRPVGEQLHELMALASAHGLYAAADWILDVVRIASEGAGANMPPTKSDTKERRCIQTVNRFGYLLRNSSCTDFDHDVANHDACSPYAHLRQICTGHDYLPEPEPATESEERCPCTRAVTGAVTEYSEYHVHHSRAGCRPCCSALSTCGGGRFTTLPPAPAAESERTEGRAATRPVSITCWAAVLEFVIDELDRAAPFVKRNMAPLIDIIESMSSQIRELARTPPAAEQSGTPNHVCGLQGFGRQDDVCPACQTPAVEQSAEGEAKPRWDKDRDNPLPGGEDDARRLRDALNERNRAKGGE